MYLYSSFDPKVTKSKLFQNLKAKVKISDKQLKYFTYQYKKVTNLSKLCLLPKIHKRLAIFLEGL